MNWYVVWARDTALAFANLERLGYDVYMPTMRVRTEKGVRICTVFGNYLFVQFDVMGEWKQIWNVRGVRSVLGGEKPSAVPIGFVEEMKMQEAERGYVADIERVFAVGEKLRVLSGPFQGHEGICAVSSGKRVALLFHLLGGQNRVYIPADAVERV